MRFEGIKVNVETYDVNDATIPGTVLEEFGEKCLSDVLTKECFIESVEGQSFQIKASWTSPEQSYKADLIIDGQRVCSWCLNATPLVAPKLSVNLRRIYPAPGKQMTFAFGKNCTTTNAEAATKDEALVSNLGTIKVIFTESVYSGHHVGKDTYHKFSKNTFGEETKKGLMKHAVEGKISATGTRRSGRHFIGGPCGESFTFIFKYRSRDWLQAEDYIEYTAPVEGEATIEPIRDDAILISDDTAQDDERRVKDEREPKRRKNPIVAQYIDLTGE